MVRPTRPLLDRLEALQRRHSIPEQRRERFRQEFHRHPEPERRILGDEAGQDLNLLPNLLEFLERRR
jgi:hypothetical protein